MFWRIVSFASSNLWPSRVSFWSRESAEYGGRVHTSGCRKSERAECAFGYGAKIAILFGNLEKHRMAGTDWCANWSLHWRSTVRNFVFRRRRMSDVLRNVRASQKLHNGSVEQNGRTPIDSKVSVFTDFETKSNTRSSLRRNIDFIQNGQLRTRIMNDRFQTTIIYYKP